MKYLYLILLVSASVSASLIELRPKEGIKAQEINHNFSFLREIFSSKNIPMEFRSFESGELILQENFEYEFDKLRLLGIQVPSLTSGKIKSEELNQAFSYGSLGAMSYDDIPLAHPLFISLDEDSSFVGAYSFVNNIGISTVIITSMPSKGIFSSLSPTTFSYTPNPNYYGLDSFTYKVFDGNNYSDEVVANITVLPVNDVPIAQSQNLVTSEETALNITLSASDVDLDPLTYIITQGPTKGQISGTLPNIVYSPHLNENGEDIIIFKVNDGKADSSAVEVKINISPVNDAPFLAINATSFTINQNEVISYPFTVLDVDNSSFIYNLTVTPLKGSVSFNDSNKTFTYTPSLNALGEDTFSFRVSDGELQTEVVTIHVLMEGFGLVKNASNVRTYFDGTVASSCYEYKLKNQGLHSYTGQTGDGLYKIKPDSGAAYDVYCDMTIDGGGWELVMTESDGVNSLAQFQSTQTGNPLSDDYRASNRLLAKDFNEILWVNHPNSEYTIFNQRLSSSFSLNDILTYEYNAFVYYASKGVRRTTNAYYNLIKCNAWSNAATPVFMLSGSNEYGDEKGPTASGKQCGSWEGDTVSWYYRFAGTVGGSYNGNPWRENGHTNVSAKLQSMYIRGKVYLNTPKDCQMVLDKGLGSTNGSYMIDPDGDALPNAPFLAYCDLETIPGEGWTLALNLDTSDGHVMWHQEPLWTNTNTYGTPDLDQDFKSPLWNTAFTKNVMMMVHEQGSVKGYRSYSVMDYKTLYEWFNSPSNTRFTNASLKANVSNLNAKEHIVKSGAYLIVNSVSGNSGNDWDRLVDNGGVAENRGGGLGNWHDTTYAPAYRTVSEAQSGWASCYGAPANYHGFFGTDTYKPATNTCNGTANQATWSQANGINYDYALFIKY